MRLEWVVIVAVGCGDGGPPSAKQPRPTTPDVGSGSGAATADPPSTTTPPPELAESPRIDLVANHIRFHVHDRGLVIPAGGEGLRKYDLEYRTAWGAAVDGGRRLERRAATLTVPWPGGAGELAVQVRGAKTLRAKLGKKKLAAAIEGDVARIAIDAPAGDHALVLEPDRKRAVIGAIELIPATGAAAGCGAPLPATARAGDALGGWARMTIVVEIPPSAYLVVAPAGAKDGAIRARVHGETDVRTLWTGTADGTRRTIDLGALADRLVELELAGCGVTWNDAAIAIAARDVPPPPPPVKNVILVVVDTLRSDRLTVYGDTRVVTPRLTRAASERGVVFRRNQSMAPSSPPSHATIHTGQIPRVHGAGGDDQPLDADAPVISAILAGAGFYVGYVGNNDFAMGRIAKSARWKKRYTPVLDGKGKDCGPIIARTLDMVREARAADQRFFLAALPIEPHVPYRYHDGITEKYFAGPFDKPLGKRVTGAHLARIRSLGMTPKRWDQLRGLYDGEVEYFDSCFAALEDGLAAAGVAGDTAIVVTSDHGEGLNDRDGRVGHAYGLHHELVNVPLIVIGGGVPAASIAAVTSNADIAPTVLELVGVAVDPRMQGMPLGAISRTGGLPRVVASEYGKSYAIRASRWHYVVGYDQRGTLHDLDSDPTESRASFDPIPLRYVRDAAGIYLRHRVAWRAATWGSLNDIAPTSPLAAPRP